VHVNFPFDKPLEPSEEGLDALRHEHPLAVTGRPGGRPFVSVARGRGAPSAEMLERVAGRCTSGRVLVVAGPAPRPWRTGPAVLRFAARAGFPVLADPLSGARFGPDLGALRPAAYDFALRSPEVRQALRPSLVLRVGSSPTSAALQEALLSWNGVEYLVLDEDGRWKDHGASATEYMVCDPVLALEALGDRLDITSHGGLAAGGESVPAAMAGEPDALGAAQSSPRGAWSGAWAALDAAAREVLDAASEEETPTHEGAIWSRLAGGAPGATVFVSNSMPVRDLDAFGLPDDRRWTVLGNRGASGIDGIVSTAFGVAAAGEEPVVCVLGDLAFFHDQNGLLWAREDDLAVVFVLVDNDGGGIFHMLPIADHEPQFTRFFATPHGLDFRHAAALHGIELVDVTHATLASELAGAVEARRTVVLRLRTRRGPARARRAELADAVAHAARERISSGPPSIDVEKRPE
jgi:2-succinyl-5-enolpyruvyl-6-hydroxy-3-cyclohexene-1-carboxylate synthase